MIVSRRVACLLFSMLSMLWPAQVVAAQAPAAPVDLLDTAISLARRDHPDLDANAVRQRIDQLAAAWKLRLADATTAWERAAALGLVLFEQEGFRSVADLESAETLHIDSVLQQRRGYCLSLSVVALAMAEQIGEPLYGVPMPNHFFVRWDDGQQRVNIELTREGELSDDAAQKERLGDFWHPGSIYLTNLTPAQVAAVLLHNRAYVDLIADRRSQARADLERVVRTLPRLPEAHRSLGILHGEQQRWEAAARCFEQALELFPGDVDSLVNLALCRDALGDHEAAVEAAELALLLDPSRARAAELLARWKRPHLPAGVHALDDPPPDLRPGLLGRYYRGEDHDRFVTERVDRSLDFDWKRGRPASGVPENRFSARWNGWFKAPTTSDYTLFVVANDGVRIRFGERLALEHWRSEGYTSWTGAEEIHLDAGWHPIEVEYFDRSDNARLVVIVGTDDSEYPLELKDHLFHQAR